jgi:hypothetical protein
VGLVAFTAALCAIGIVERIQFRLRFLEARTWWASNGRDVLNTVAFLTLLGSLALLGFTGPLLVLIASVIVLLMNTVQASLGTRPGATFMSVAAALILGAPVLVAPAWVDHGMKALLEFLF